MCERGVVTPDVSGTAGVGRQTITTTSHKSTVRLFLATQYSMVSGYICKLWNCRG